MALWIAVLFLLSVVLLSGAGGAILIDLAIEQGKKSSVLAMQLAVPAVLGTAVSVASLFWLKRAPHNPSFVVLKFVAVYILLAISGIAAGFGLGGEYRLHDLEPEDPVSVAMQQRVANEALAKYKGQLIPDVVHSDRHLGLRTLQSALAISPEKNMVVCPPALAQILHIDIALGDQQTKSEIQAAAALTSVPAAISAGDRAVRELITHCSPGVVTNWSMAIAVSPSIDPSQQLQELSQLYCDKGVERDTNLEPEMSRFTTTINFNGKWLHRFDAQETKPGNFFAPRKTARLPFMHHEFNDDSKVYYLESSKATVVGLPYKNNEQHAYLILPPKQSNLQMFVHNLSVDSLERLTNSGTFRNGRLAMPKLTIVAEQQNLNGILDHLGVKRLFNGNMNSLPGLANNSGGAYAAGITQNVRLSLDENGTKVLFSIQQLNRLNSYHREDEPFDVTFDRPFLLAIKDSRTGEFLFLGAIFEPKAS